MWHVSPSNFDQSAPTCRHLGRYTCPTACCTPKIDIHISTTASELSRVTQHVQQYHVFTLNKPTTTFRKPFSNVKRQQAPAIAETAHHIDLLIVSFS